MGEVTVNITGYRQLTADQQGEINDVKALAEKVGELVKNMRGYDNLDQRWVSIGATDLQTGFMALVRAIAQPDSF
jgi:hypothetical protein